MKVCTKCKKKQDSVEFRPCPKAKDGLDYWCNTCNREYLTEYSREYQKRPAVRDRRNEQKRLARQDPDKKRKTNIRQKELARNLRLAVLAFLGNKCKRCGFSDNRALQIDHVHGGGKQELKGLSREQYYHKVLADSEGLYQLLCANCNWIKRHENQELYAR